MNIDTYNRKRDFDKTKEPKGKISSDKGDLFVVQEHFASRHHFDFRLELDGVLKSWAVPKGPSLDPKVKRLAIHVEDHPLEYANFEGVIPQGEYGGGQVILWDTGVWRPKGDPEEAYRKGKLEFELRGKKLRGNWTLVRTKSRGRQESWLLIKKGDESAAPRPKPEHSVRPQLAKLSPKAPEGEEWLREIKFDGYRTLAKLENGRCGLYTRNIEDWTERYPLIAGALMTESPEEALLDGEIVWLNEKGISSFEGLQKALKTGDHSRLYYYVFDVLELDGVDRKKLPQRERKELARKVVDRIGNKRIRYSEHFIGTGRDVMENVCSMGLEGAVSKRADDSYTQGRSDSWIKTKCEKSDEFLIAGYLPRKDAKEEVGALVLGAHRGQELVIAGKVGTGFDRRQRRELFSLLQEKKTDSPAGVGDLKDKDIVWTRPELAAQIKYTELTKAGKLRHPVFVELREDKLPEEVAMPGESAANGKESGQLLAQIITSPDKVLFPDSTATKMDLGRYYAMIYPFMRAHIENKILNLLKCPNGAGGECFFNKHIGNMKGVHPVEVERKGKTERYMCIDSLEGLLHLARYNALEIHTWNSRAQSYETPDELVFDLDPGKGVSKKKVVNSAFELKEVLESLGLKSWPKSTGGKGLHLQVPLAPVHSAEQVYNFAKSVALIMEEEAPERYTSNSRFENREGKIFLDYLRNSPGATFIAPYSTRAKPGGPLAMPLSWKELKGFDIEDPYLLEDFLKKGISGYKNPWRDYRRSPQRIEAFFP